MSIRRSASGDPEWIRTADALFTNQDLGRPQRAASPAVSPRTVHRTAASQLRGGIVMGLGLALSEATLIDVCSGRIMNPLKLVVLFGGTGRRRWPPELRPRPIPYSKSGADERLEGIIERDERGFVLTGSDLVRQRRTPKGWSLGRSPLLLETSVRGVFAAGDMRHGAVQRVASAVGEGAIAIMLVHHYLSERVETSVS